MSNWQRIWLAPAKINLFLHVVGRRPDGYHLLQTVFRFLDFADTLRFTPRDDDAIVLATPISGVPPANDLTVQAANALRTRIGNKAGVTISLTKRLPIGGGLGGGSSDAATTLMALNYLWNCGLTTNELQALGLALGADVAVFVHGRACFAEGIGERFTDVTLPPAWYLITVPEVSVPTGEIFRAPDLRRDTPTIAPEMWRSGQGGNDLESIACAQYPEVRRHLDWLRARGAARMSGSGACCFAEFATQAQARAALSALPAEIRGFVACGLDRHPLRIPDARGVNHTE
jgi:4-diphosphocytidyl-2-C-methyl-D-erythritol kinase